MVILDPAAIAKGFSESGGYYLAGLLTLAMSFVFVLYREAMNGRLADSKAESGKLRERVDKLEGKLDAVQAQRDSQYERIITTANGVITVQAALERRLPKPRATEGA